MCIIRILFTILFLGFSSFISGQSLVFTTLRASELKLNDPLDSVNKYLDERVVIKHGKVIDEIEYDTINTVYKNTQIRLIFISYFDYQKKKSVILLDDIYSADLNIQTKSGIKIGDDKFDIIRKLDGSYLVVGQETDMDKEYSYVSLFDKNDKVITFHFKRNKLYSIEISNGANDEC